MTQHQNNIQEDPEDPVMSEDVEFVDDDAAENTPDERASRSRNFNLSMRHRIEDKLEQRRLKKELGDYEFLDLEDDDKLH